MTTQESFKKRIRVRMSATGEKYTAARRALLDPPPPTSAGGWVSQPEVSDAKLIAHTGRGYDEWASLIEAGPGRDAGHAVIAAWLAEEHGVDRWWCQTVTVGYERITGLRLPGQMPDGTFTVSRSRTLPMPPEDLRALLEDDDARAEALPEVAAERASRPGVRSPRFTLTDATSGESLGTLQLSFDAASTGTKLTVTHEKLADARATEPWKTFWAAWLENLSLEMAAEE